MTEREALRLVSAAADLERDLAIEANDVGIGPVRTALLEAELAAGQARIHAEKVYALVCQARP